MEKEERGNIIQRLITKKIVFCNPTLDKNDYKNIISNFEDKLIFIKKNNDSDTIDDYIPCLFYRRKTSSNFLIYFHGNSENIFQIEDYGLDFRSYLDMNILLVEYPGYFLKSQKEINPKLIFENSLIVYDWIKSTFSIPDKNIFICGRSLGTSPAIYLSSKRNPKALFLISAFTSIKNIGGDKYLSIFVEKIFESINYIKDVKCPILFIHGLEDPLISYHHSEELWNEAKKNNKNIEIIKRPKRDHNNFNLKEDIIDEIIKFCETKELISKENQSNDIIINKSDELYKIPFSIRKFLETYIFDINEFKIIKTTTIKDAHTLINFGDEKIIILINGSKVSFYSDRILLINEIDFCNIKKREVTIKSFYLMQNGNFICALKEGDIFIFKINKRKYEIIKNISYEEEIYKVGDISQNYIGLLSKNYIAFFDSNFQEIFSKKKNENFINFCKFSDNGLAMIKQRTISINKIENDNIINIKEITDLEMNGYPNTIVETKQFLIVGGIRYIYFININKNFECEFMKFSDSNLEEISFIYKVHDQLLLASSDKGSILQIIIKECGEKEILKRNIKNIRISSILMTNYDNILISGDNEIDILTSLKQKEEEKKSRDCIIF